MMKEAELDQSGRASIRPIIKYKYTLTNPMFLQYPFCIKSFTLYALGTGSRPLRQAESESYY